MSQFQFYKQPNTQLRFPINKPLFQKMQSFLIQNNLVLAEQIKHSQGTSTQILFNEICGYGFQPEDVGKMLTSFFSDDYLLTNPLPSDKDKPTFILRSNQVRTQILKTMLLQLPISNIPQSLGGSLQDNCGFHSAQVASSQSSQILPMAKMGERKPKGKRRQGDNGLSLEDVQGVQMEFDNAIEMVSKTGLVSEPLIRDIVQICGGNLYLSYLTVITSCMQYKKGYPRVPLKFKNDEKLQSSLGYLRQGELQTIQASGFEIQSYTENSKVKMPHCYVGLEVWTVKVPIFIFQDMQINLYFHLQDLDDVLLMQEKTKFITDPPLIADGNMWKFNLQFKGTYPLTPCYIDLKSKQLSNFGKAVTLKYLYSKLQKAQFNEQPIFGCILALQDNEYEKYLSQYEEALQQYLQKSVFNIKNISPTELKNSFVMRIKKQLQQRQNQKLNKAISISPLLFIYNIGSPAAQLIQSSITTETNEFLFVEDKFSQLNEQIPKLLNKYPYQAPKLQKQLDIYIPTQQADIKSSNFQLPSTSTYAQILNQRNQTVYNSFLPHRQHLPIYIDQKALLQNLSDSSCTIITAETGSGKSTNLPQIIIENNTTARVLVTQPRRIAAISLAQRVRQESGFVDGKVIGFNVKGKTEVSKDSLIIYCTIGVILRQFVNNSDEILKYSHLVIDEVHERDVNTDLFLGMLKGYYQEFYQVKKLPKIVIMSATIDGEKFGRYFNFLEPKFYSVSGRMFATKTYFLDELMELNSCIKPIYEKDKSSYKQDNDQYYDDFDYNDDDIDNFQYGVSGVIDDFTLNVQAIKQIVLTQIYLNSSVKGNTLIFLPGQKEIERVISVLSGIKELDLEILPCHSMISMKDSQRLFMKSNRNRVICATNIAEASITLPDIIAVIDSGIERKVKYYAKQRKNVFGTNFISKESAKQRAGRAGRICKGTIYCTYQRSTFDSFAEHRVPEICNASLMNSSMQLLLFSSKLSLISRELANIMQPHIFFAQLPDPPKQSSVQSNLKELLVNNFITMESNNIKLAIEEQLVHPDTSLYLTNFGQEVAFLPIEPLLGKILYFASKFKINMDMAKKLVAILSVGQQQILKRINSACINLERKSDHLLLFKLFEKYLKGENMKQYEITQFGMESAKDTYYQLKEDEKVVEQDDFIFIIPLLQISLWPALAYINGRSGYQLTNPKNHLLIHPGSTIKNKISNIIFYNEQLITSQNFITTCSVGSAVALLYNCEKPEIDFRRGLLILNTVEYAIPPLYAVILIEFVKQTKLYNCDLQFLRQLMSYEMQAFQ